MQRFGCSQRNTLHVVGLSFSTYRYEPRRFEETVLKMRIKENRVQGRTEPFSRNDWPE
jgi:hypothetical protein